jgi:hypothetical protein
MGVKVMGISWLIAKQAIGGFIGSYGKLIGIGAVAIFIIGTFFWIRGAFNERDKLLDERKMTITQLAVDKSEALISKQFAEDALARMIADEARMKTLYNNTLALQDTFAAEMKEQTEVLEKHNLTELTNAKPGLIEIRANKATKERSDELMQIINN